MPKVMSLAFRTRRKRNIPRFLKSKTVNDKPVCQEARLVDSAQFILSILDKIVNEAPTDDLCITT